MGWYINSWRDMDYVESERLQSAMIYLLEKFCRCFFMDEMDSIVYDMVNHNNESRAFCRVFVNLLSKWNTAEVMDAETLKHEKEKRERDGMIISAMSELADNCTGYWTEYASRIASHLNTFIDEFIEDSGQYVSTFLCTVPQYGEEVLDVKRPSWKEEGRTARVERPNTAEVTTD